VGIRSDREVLARHSPWTDGGVRVRSDPPCTSWPAPFNVNSVKQLRTVLYDDLGLKPGGDQDRLLDRRPASSRCAPHPIMEVLLRYRRWRSSAPPTGRRSPPRCPRRAHPRHVRQTVARTRAGCRRTVQPAQHPRSHRRGRRFPQAFVPSAGRRLLVADYDQVELRAIAHLSGDRGSRRLRRRRGIHRTVAARVFGVGS